MAGLAGGEKPADVGGEVVVAVVEGVKASPNDAVAGDDDEAIGGRAEKASPNPFELPVDGADLPVGQADPPPFALPPSASHSLPPFVPPVLTIRLSLASSAGGTAQAMPPFVGRPRRMGEMVSARLGAGASVGAVGALRILE